MSEPNVLQKKICMLGAFAVGKTSLVRRFVEGRFDDKYLSTLGVKISRKPVSIAGRAIHLIIWDTAGSEEYNGIRESYLQGAAGGIIVCDLTRPETLEEWPYYAQKLRQVNPAAKIILVANKSDLVEERAISDDDLQRAAASSQKEGDIPLYFLTSAKSDQNVEEVFRQLAKQLL